MRVFNKRIILMPRTIGWFSSGAASAVAIKISNPDLIVFCDTGSEDEDNKRFMSDCEKWYDRKITVLKNEKFKDTWEVWEKRKYISGIAGAPCTGELKIKPRVSFQKPGDVHIFGYTADSKDIKRAESLRENYPDLTVKTPLIERGIKKAGCLAMIESAGIKPPRVYAMGFPNANCIPCCKATSPAYWALVRRNFPKEFNRMLELSKKLSVRLTKINGERAFIDEIPEDHAITEALAPECDMLCWLAEQELFEIGC
jgi:hypothetical protein